MKMVPKVRIGLFNDQLVKKRIGTKKVMLLNNRYNI